MRWGRCPNLRQHLAARGHRLRLGSQGSTLAKYTEGTTPRAALFQGQVVDERQRPVEVGGEEELALAVSRSSPTHSPEALRHRGRAPGQRWCPTASTAPAPSRTSRVARGRRESSSKINPWNPYLW